MSRIQRIVALAVVGLLGAIGVTGVMAGAGGVFGGSSDDSTAAAESAGIQTSDSLVAESGDTPDGESEVVVGDVNGDQGDTNDQGDDENDADGQEVAGDVIDCPAGEETQFKFEQSASEFEVTGTLVSFDGTTVVVTGPAGDVTAAVDPNAEVKGDLSAAGTPVKVEGSILDGAFVAHEIEPACENEDDSDDADEHHDANDGSSSSGDEESGSSDSAGEDSGRDSGHDDSSGLGGSDHGVED